MTKTGRRAACVAVAAALLGWTSGAAAMESGATVGVEPWLMTPDARVRAVSPRVVAIINEAAAQSKTFRGLVDHIETTDGIVYVAEGLCGHGVWACLLDTMTIAGRNRVLRILVDPRKTDRDLMGSIGHELQHAIEVLSHLTVRNYSAMILLRKEMCNACGLRFETDAAIRAGVAVREELQRVIMGKTSSVAARESGERAVVVRIDHDGAVSARELQFAEERATEVFRRSGIRVTWVEEETAIQEQTRPLYTVVIVAARRGHEDGDPKGLVDDTLGLAAPAVHRAYVYYDRVVAMKIGSARSIGSVLGDVIAHELGHLLLPSPGHSFTGIMRPNLGVKVPIETFDESQAQHIRSRLRQAP